MDADRFKDSTPLPDDLAVYDGKVSELRVDGRPCGYVHVRVDSMYEVTRVLFQRRTPAQDRIFLDVVLLRPDGSLLEWIPDGPLDEREAREQLGTESMVIRGCRTKSRCSRADRWTRC
ncbi:hypothetical protein AB0M48_01740 [Lentzea sp. NPDC051208]|uniref:hypothetical protein n=1 Tax=Lentzea sp. NPDC051208 TaxID=3154642 RepID=UPI00341AD334